MSRGSRILKRAGIGFAGLLVLIFIALQVALNSKVLTGLVNRIADEYVEGEVRFTRVRASVFRSFPHLNVALEDFAVTYPHDRFAEYEMGRRSRGGGETMDTLASFRELSVSVNYLAAIGGKYKIRSAALRKPRIFLHAYDSAAANWNILKLPLGGQKDTARSRSGLPPVSLRKISLTERPVIVFANPADTIFGVFTLKDLLFEGNLMLDNLPESAVRIDLDSLFIAGRLPADTVALAVDYLGVDGAKQDFRLSIDAKTFLATNSFGRLTVPIGIEAAIGLPERKDKAVEVDVRDFRLSVATIEMDASGSVVLQSDSTYVRAEAAIEESPISEIVRLYGDNFPSFKKLATDAKLSLKAECEGYFAEGILPEITAAVRIPVSSVKYEGVDRDARIHLDAAARTDDSGRLNVSLRDLWMDAGGLQLKAQGTADDLLGEDPLFGFEGSLRARIDTLTRLLTAQRGISGTGDVDVEVKGKLRKSQMDAYRFTKADLYGKLTIADLQLRDAPDTVEAMIGHADILLASTGNKYDSTMRAGARVLGLMASIDTVDVTYQEDMFLRGSKLSLVAQNSSEILNRKSASKFQPLMGFFKAERLRLRDGESLSVHVRHSDESFRIIPATREGGLTTLKLSGSNERIGIRQSVNRFGVRKLNVDATAKMHLRNERSRERRRHFLDSLQRVYPGVPRDSLMAKMRSERKLPSWMAEKDFQKKDIQLNVNESLKKYFREWDLGGTVAADRISVMTPYFPLRTRVADVKGSFSNDRIDLENITVTSGESDLTADASLSGLRRAVLGRGILKLDAHIASDNIDVNELLGAYAAGSQYVPDTKADSLSDEAYQKVLDEVSAEAVPDSLSKLLVVPANLEANVSVGVRRIRYDSLTINWAAVDLAMRQRCLQVTNTMAASNMGDIYFEGFYSTQTKEDIKAGFDVNFVNITADRVIELMPAADTILPILKSFKGNLDCEMAVTTQIDTNMNLILPSIDGIIKIGGRNLSFADSKEFTKVARLLMFKDNRVGRIETMSVDGMIRNNVLEIFPCVVQLDRYTMAASGLQHLDESFQYHISVIKSPLPLKFGINLWGTDFGSMKFGLGKARYTNTRVPVFTMQIDTVQRNLVNSIHNIFEIGVERAMAANESQNIIQREMQKTDYAVDPVTDTLSAAEMIVLKMAEDTLSAAVPVDSVWVPEPEEFEIDGNKMLREARRHVRQERRGSRREARKEDE